MAGSVSGLAKQNSSTSVVVANTFSPTNRYPTPVLKWHICCLDRPAITCWRNSNLRLASAADCCISILLATWSTLSPLPSLTAGISPAFDVVRADLHRSFDDNGWFLLPELKIFNRMLAFDPRAGRTYEQLFTRKIFTYRLVPLKLFTDNGGIFRRDDPAPSGTPDSDTPDPATPDSVPAGAPDSSASDTSDPDASDFAAFFPPLPTYRRIFPVGPGEPLPAIESRVNPFFVVANAEPKLAAERDLKDSGHA
ncbi:hypothetical protein C8R44DRAFT_991451 [Mycena epipterygia]|nr:hypothetical protein C8R44DRAFT_991451 [Mycena epipterygia]